MRFASEKLIAWCVENLEKSGLDYNEAKTVAQVLISADERGINSHGIIRAEGYIQCLQSGGIAANAVHTIINDGPSYALVDANRGLGIPVSVFAMDLAIEKAKKSGIAIVNVFNSHHHGACGYYTLRCADRGLIGLAMSTGDIIMAITGAASNSIGNNPFSYAVPAGRYRSICYDIAMSTVAAGKISMAAVEKRSIPLGWLLDPDGNPTTDPDDYAKGGPLCPFGGYKGYGLSMMVESLAGILSSAALLKDIHAWNMDPNSSGNVGHCFIAIDPAVINPGFSIPERAEQMIDQLLSQKKAPGVQRIVFPGQLENEKEVDSKEHGVLLPEATLVALKHISEITGIIFNRDTLKK
ncbi:MAG: Ldh family oxidoreductase [Spirochaetales bacterium]|nr:Ldh family oxidoreductase [Spirochaetales bacterium]